MVNAVNDGPLGAQTSATQCRSQARINGEGCVKKGIRRKNLPIQTIMRIINDSTIPNRSRPGLPTTVYGAVPQQGAGGQYVTVGRKRRRREGGRVRKKQERRKDRKVKIKVWSLNVGTMTGKGREMADMMEKKIDVLRVQETKWRGNKVRLIGGSCKLLYYGVDGRRNGIGVIVKEKYINSVLEVKRVSDRVMSLKMETEAIQINMISAYALQVGCELDEKE
ncbi:uncharacterized protein LOC135108197 [Scylla paramamosain]|uniref:uncharacterized protein LOC135108197 n=1 Tax=Scylla paramamosain TaxID=85552 RepID=UPI003082AE54